MSSSARSACTTILSLILAVIGTVRHREHDDRAAQRFRAKVRLYGETVTEQEAFHAGQLQDTLVRADPVLSVVL